MRPRALHLADMLMMTQQALRQRCSRPASTHLPGIHISTGLDGHDVSVLSEDLAEHRILELALCILVEGQLCQVTQVQRRSGDRVLVELLDVGDDVAEVKDCAVCRAGLSSASLQSSAVDSGCFLNCLCKCLLVNTVEHLLDACTPTTCGQSGKPDSFSTCFPSWTTKQNSSQV